MASIIPFFFAILKEYLKSIIENNNKNIVYPKLIINSFIKDSILNPNKEFLKRETK